MAIPQLVYSFTCLVDIWVISLFIAVFLYITDVSNKAAKGLMLESWRREALFLLGVEGT